MVLDICGALEGSRTSKGSETLNGSITLKASWSVDLGVRSLMGYKLDGKGLLRFGLVFVRKYEKIVRCEVNTLVWHWILHQVINHARLLQKEQYLPIG